MIAKHPIKSALVLALVAGLAFAAVLAADDDDYKKGWQAYQAKRYDEAIRIFKGVVEEYPDWHFGIYMLGKSYKAKGDYTQAIRSLDRAVNVAESQDDRFADYYELADTYYNSRNYSKALEFARQADKLTSAKGYSKAAPQIRLIVGFSNYNIGRHRDAISALRPLVDSGGANANVLKTVAKSYDALGDSANAVNVIQKVVRKDPRDVTAHKILVKSHINASKWADAISAAKFAIQYIPRDWELHYLKGLAHQRRNQISDAAVSLEQSIVIRSVEKVHRLLGDVYIAQGKYFEATRQFDQAQRAYIDDAAFYTKFAFCYYEFVPKDTENYKGKRQEGSFKTALANAIALLDKASRLSGADRAQIAAMRDGIRNKSERLEKGKFIREQYEIFIDPETGEVIKRKIGGDGESQ